MGIVIDILDWDNQYSYWIEGWNHIFSNPMFTTAVVFATMNKNRVCMVYKKF